MKSIINTVVTALVLIISFRIEAQQVLDVTVVNNGNNAIQVIGTATAPGFAASPENTWSSMNLTWRIPKGAAVPAPTAAPPSTTPEITAENTAFNGATPRDAFNNTGVDLTVFDLTAFGQPDDGYWYFQVTGTTGNTQAIATGASVVLYEFTTPVVWSCTGCVEVLTTDVPGLPISTTSFIDNAGLGTDVLNLVVNMAPLPVQFLGFEAHYNGSAVNLEWRVADEQLVNGYYVERSANGLTWERIGFVPFQPSMSSVNTYKLVDQSPLYGTSYYRIAQQDIDGKMLYSIIRKIQLMNDLWQVSIYPVPVKNVLNINIRSNTRETVRLRITDALGRMIQNLKMPLQRGDQTETILLGGLKAGMYYIEIQDGDRKWTGKFIKE